MGYRGKVVEKERARELRAEAWTLQDIATELGVAKSSVSLWVRDVEFEPRGRRAIRRREPNALQRRRLAEIEAMNERGVEMVGSLSAAAFLVAGAALYAGEGSKRDGVLAVANSDPAIIRFFVAWLRSTFDIDESRLRGQLYLHEGLDLDAAVSHWSAVAGIPESQFTKPYRAVPDVGIRHNKHEHGCFTVRYSCSRTHRAVMGLVRALLSCDDLPG